MKRIKSITPYQLTHCKVTGQCHKYLLGPPRRATTGILSCFFRHELSCSVLCRRGWGVCCVSLVFKIASIWVTAHGFLKSRSHRKALTHSSHHFKVIQKPPTHCRHVKSNLPWLANQCRLESAYGVKCKVTVRVSFDGGDQKVIPWPNSKWM